MTPEFEPPEVKPENPGKSALDPSIFRLLILLIVLVMAIEELSKPPLVEEDQ